MTRRSTSESERDEPDGAEPDEVEAALARVAGALPAGEVRSGQIAMARAVAESIRDQRHLVVQAGTGTGKSLAYLVPAILAGRRVVVATATKALQDQLVGKDLPFLESHLDRSFTFACLKGRSNYLCVQRTREEAASERLELDRSTGRQVRDLIGWATEQLDGDGTGDRAELGFEPSPAAWASVSVSARECPGANRCPAGDVCFAERARDAAAVADVVVVNTHLYGTHLAAEGAVLPDHDVAVIDEAHVLADVVSATAGVELSATRFAAVAGALRGILAEDELPASVVDVGSRLTDAFASHEHQRITSIEGELGDVLALARNRLELTLTALRRISQPSPDVAARKERAVRLTSSLIDDLDATVSLPQGRVTWIEPGSGPGRQPMLRQAPVDVRTHLAELFEKPSVILTSATLSDAVPAQLGMPPERSRFLDVGSPFDFKTNARLYCARHLPDARSPDFEAAMHDELAVLIEAAGGRTLALFTSWNRMRGAVAAIRDRIDFPVLAQGELPKPVLVSRFASDEETCLFATMGFWQGIDVPGRSLSLVTIDRLPFTPPDDPLTQARRDAAGPAAFTLIDVPRAATMLAQGTGRLIRTATDRGVVAVFDRRLATMNYRHQILAALPPMRRVVNRDEIVSFLTSLAA